MKNLHEPKYNFTISYEPEILVTLSHGRGEIDQGNYWKITFPEWVVIPRDVSREFECYANNLWWVSIPYHNTRNELAIIPTEGLDINKITMSRAINSLMIEMIADGQFDSLQIDYKSGWRWN